MDRKKAENIIAKLSEEVNEYFDPHAYKTGFRPWRAKAIRYIEEIFGSRSRQSTTLQEILYLKPNFSIFGGMDFQDKIDIQNVIVNFSTTFDTFLEDLKLLEYKASETREVSRKIFISHASKDDNIGKEIINLLQLIGVRHDQIFYTSSAGYGIPLGKDWVETIKSEVSGEGMVLSLLSENYFSSQICLLEMGATWVLSKLHVPILIPPLTFKDTNEIINSTQGFHILDRLRWSSLKRELEKLFELEPLPEDKWEPQRDSILGRIENLLHSK